MDDEETNPLLGLLAAEIGDVGDVPGSPDPLAPAPAQPKFNDRDRYGRYKLRHPSKDAMLAASRTTTVVGAAEDMFNLAQWQKANVVMGLARRPDLIAMAAGCKPGDKRLRGLVEDAEDAGGGNVAANMGTAMHAFTEDVDRGGRYADVPETYRADVAAYRGALYRYRLTVVPMAIERVTMTSRWDGVAGTFDRIYRLHDGTYAIGDVKTGSVTYDSRKMEGQLAVYAAGANEVGVYDVAEKRWDRLPFDVRTDFGLIVHIPVGQGECTVYKADLERGREHVAFCAEVRRYRKAKGRLRPYEFDRYTEDGWRDVLAQARTRETLQVIGRLINADGAMTESLREFARERMAELPEQG